MLGPPRLGSGHYARDASIKVISSLSAWEKKKLIEVRGFRICVRLRRVAFDPYASQTWQEEEKVPPIRLQLGLGRAAKHPANSTRAASFSRETCLAGQKFCPSEGEKKSPWSIQMSGNEMITFFELFFAS